jgi:hypothetical protein
MIAKYGVWNLNIAMPGYSSEGIEQSISIRPLPAAYRTVPEEFPKKISAICLESLFLF